MRYLFFFLFFFSFMYAYADSVTAQGSNQDFSVLYSQSFNLDKPTTVNCTINSSDGLNLYNATTTIEILLNGSVYSKRSYNQQPSDFTGGSHSAVIPPGVVTVRFSFLLRGGRSCTYSVSLGSSCPSTSQCQSLTCPYCTTTYCSVHTVHYTATHSSAACKVSMHSFCTDNQSAYNAYQQAISSATNLCSTCSSTYCKICGHTCGNSSCPSLPDCSFTSCSVCKSSYCSTHGLHICTAVGNASNGSSGPWNVWTQQNGTNITVNVEADFNELVQAQQNANVLLQNIDNTIKGFITQQDEFNKSINNHLSQTNDNISKLIESAGQIDDNVFSIKEYLSEFRHEIYPELDFLFHEIKSNSQTLIDALYSNSAEIINNQNNLYTLLSGPLKFDFSSLLSPLNSIKSNTSKIEDFVSDLKSNSNYLKTKSDDIFDQIESINSNTNHIRTNLSDIKDDTIQIRSNTTQIKEYSESIDSSNKAIANKMTEVQSDLGTLSNNVLDLKTDVSSIKTINEDFLKVSKDIKADVTAIKTTNEESSKSVKNIDTQVSEINKTLKELNTNVQPQGQPSTTSNSLNVPKIADPTKYKTEIGPIDSSKSIPTDRLSGNSEKIKTALDKLPKVTNPSYQPLILDIPLTTDFFDFSFSLDLNGGSHAPTVQAAKEISHALFSVFWVISFSFLFIRTLRQW